MVRQRQYTAEQQAERHADQQSAYRANQDRLRDIGPLPPVADQARRDPAEESLLFFLSNYFSLWVEFRCIASCRPKEGHEPITMVALLGHKDGTMLCRHYDGISTDDDHLRAAAQATEE